MDLCDWHSNLQHLACHVTIYYKDPIERNEKMRGLADMDFGCRIKLDEI